MTRHESEVERDLDRLIELGEAQVLLLELIAELLAPPPPPPDTTTAVLSVQIDSGGNMATLATLTFTGVPPTPPPGDGSGLVVTFASDNPNVTLGTASASGDTATAPITGTEAFNLSAVVANVSGVTPLLDADGVSEFIQPSPIAVPAVAVPDTTTAVLSTD